MNRPRSSGASRAVMAVAAAAVLLAAAIWVLLAGEESRPEVKPEPAPHAAVAESHPQAPAVAALTGDDGEGRTAVGSDADPFGTGPLTSLAFEIVGRVVDTDRKPVKGASIELFVSPWPILSTSLIPGYRESGVRIEEHRVKTGADGAFRFRGPYDEGRDYFLVAKFPERAPAVKRGFVVERGVHCDAGELVLDKGLSVSGIVVGPTGEPLPAARVSVVETPSFSAVERFLEQSEPEDWATADGEGKFEVKNLTEGRYVVVAFSKGFARGATPPVTLARDKDSASVVVNLAQGASILGVVSNPEGAGIERAKVKVRISRNVELSGRGVYRGPGDSGGVDTSGEDSLNCDYPISVLTNAAGQFEAEGLVAGSIYGVSATADGYRQSGNQVVNAGHANVTISLRPDFEIRGTVVDADTGEPISGAKVGRFGGRVDELKRGVEQLPPPQGGTDGQGRFVARDNGKAGAAVLLAWFPSSGSVKNPGYQPSVSESFTITEGQPAPEVKIKMTKGSAVVGTVVSAASGEALVNTAVQLFSVRDPNAPNPRLYSPGGLMGSATTDSKGKFAFEGLLPGFYLVEARAFTAGGNRSEVVNLGTSDRREGMRIVIPVAGAIRGAVVSSGTLTSVRVTATRADGLSFSKFADGENRFALEKLPAGLYRVSASKLTSFEERGEWGNRRGGTSENSVSVDLKDGQVVALTLDLPDSNIGRLTGSVMDGGDPGAGYTVVAVRENPSQKVNLNADPNRDPVFGNFRSATADVHGNFEFPGLREASYRIYAIPRGKGLTPKNAMASDFVQVFGNAEARRDLFGRSGPLRGTVLRPNGQGMNGVQVIAVVNGTRSPTPVLPAGTRFTARTKGDGSFNFGKLPGGAYDVTAEQGAFPRKTVGVEIYGASTEPVQIQLEQPQKGGSKAPPVKK